MNATAVAKYFNKIPKDYLKTEQTQEYIAALAEHLSVRTKIPTEQNQLVIVKQGGLSHEQGTWLHPKLAIHFARWLNPKFAVWCDEQIENMLNGKHSVQSNKISHEQVALLPHLCFQFARVHPHYDMMDLMRSMFGAAKVSFGERDITQFTQEEFGRAISFFAESLLTYNPLRHGEKPKPTFTRLSRDEKSMIGEFLDTALDKSAAFRLPEPKQKDHNIGTFLYQYGAGETDLSYEDAIQDAMELKDVFDLMVTLAIKSDEFDATNTSTLHHVTMQINNLAFMVFEMAQNVKKARLS
ncbi:KilA-N domain-containing protein [Alysiella crassa]|uniref:KilA-N domain n=1 Tax=Alysiella crassa TaxID=153491 RepID=A0A376BU54_9NEIS|nr:KilA-N domain-containing protein [Alysiella crassa]UOP05878.1 KilA-N domain-containing protein [Alysiella crassa]SSY80305.1 KilA-N domain [Alysiella crassa]